MKTTNLINILRNSIDILYEKIPFDKIPRKKVSNYVVNNIYKQLINPEGIRLNNILKKDPTLTTEDFQFYRIVIILTMISDFYEYYTYVHYKEDMDDTIREIYEFLDTNCDFRKSLNLFFTNKRYAKAIIKTYTMYDIKDKNTYINNLILNKKIDTVVKLNPYVLVEYINYFDNDLKEEDKITQLLKECLVNDDNRKMESILNNNDSVSPVQINDNATLKEMFIQKLNNYYNNDSIKIENAIRYIIYDVLNGMITLSSNNLISKDNMLNILKVTDLYFNNPKKAVEEFYNNQEFSNAILDTFADIHYTYNKLLDFSQETFISDDTKKIIKKYNPFIQD